IPTILREEQGLAAAFPQEWPQFIATTPRFFPRFWRLAALKGIRWDRQQWLRNREYQALLTVLLVLLLLHLYAE
ncbi:MAG: hypothetical protein HQL48_03135, partial [Gammaproteobacteria bacterium]|nr:hypothetical protein [Gammaproteobacteria bacterium]